MFAYFTPAIVAQINLAAIVPWLLAVASLATAGLVRSRMAARLRESEARAQHAERKARLGLARVEQDRARLAKTLHDGPVQDLLALGMESRVSAHLGLPETAPNVAEVARQLRAVSEGLRPPALGPFGLGAAITSHVERFQEGYPGLTVSLDLDADDLPAETRLALFRIAQEALENAARDPSPVHVDIRLTVSDVGADLTIRVDGRGREISGDALARSQTGRYDSLGMLMQAESVGAEFRVQSALDRTVVHVNAPPILPNWV